MEYLPCAVHLSAVQSGWWCADSNSKKWSQRTGIRR